LTFEHPKACPLVSASEEYANSTVLVMNPNQQVLNVHWLPRHVAAADLAGGAVVVIDVLRATSTICQAIASGAAEVVPFLEVNEAVAAAERAGRSNIVLGGERNGGKIPDFDLGNSPCEYTPEAVAGRRVFITTTNGTRALDHAKLAKRVLLGAFTNLSAVARSIQDEPRVEILCAGTDGGETREDILAAGAIVSRLLERSSAPPKLNDHASAAKQDWNELVARARASARPLTELLAIELCHTQGGRNLLGIDLNRDLVDCAEIDRLTIVPELNIRDWRIT
jgi:2-phosphosulfolactate phosphatase